MYRENTTFGLDMEENGGKLNTKNGYVVQADLEKKKRGIVKVWSLERPRGEKI